MTKPILLALIPCLMLLGCGVSQRTVLDAEPLGYDHAMEMLAAEIQRVDKLVTGGQYRSAESEAERALYLATKLEGYEPPRMGKSYADYTEYQAQAGDMRRAADRLLFAVQQRRRDQANEELVGAAYRYNFISVRYGPNIQIGVLERGPERLRRPTDYRSELPGELRGSR